MMDTDDWDEAMYLKELTKPIPTNIYLTIERILNWAEERNILEGSLPKDQLAKLMQELGEVSDALCKHDTVLLKKEIGDMLVVLAILADMFQLTLPECAEAAYEKIKHRRGVMFDGVFIKETDDEYPEILRKLSMQK